MTDPWDDGIFTDPFFVDLLWEIYRRPMDPLWDWKSKTCKI